MTANPTLNVEHRLNAAGRLFVKAIPLANRIGIKVPAPLVAWIVNNTSQVRVNGGNWQSIKLDADRPQPKARLRWHAHALLRVATAVARHSRFRIPHRWVDAVCRAAWLVRTNQGTWAPARMNAHGRLYLA